MMQPVAKSTAAHRGDADIERGEQGRRQSTTGRRCGRPTQGLGDFEIAPGDGVKHQIFVAGLDRQRMHMAHAAALRALRVFEQRACRAERERKAGTTEAVQRRGFELLPQRAFTRAGIEIPGVLHRARNHLRDQPGVRAIGDDDFRRAQALELMRKTPWRDFSEHQLAAGEIEPGGTHQPLVRHQRHQ